MTIAARRKAACIFVHQASASALPRLDVHAGELLERDVSWRARQFGYVVVEAKLLDTPGW
jgi:hypothetical protein